jgi:hypothetical protein
MSNPDQPRRTTSSFRVRGPSGAIAITLTNLLTDVERDFFAREAELRDASGRFDAGDGESKRSAWRSFAMLGVVASLAGLVSFSIVRFQSDVLGGIVAGVLRGEGISANGSSGSPAPSASVPPTAPAAALAAPAAARPTPSAPPAVAPRPIEIVALVSTAPATAPAIAPTATTPAAHRAHHRRASRHGSHARGKHRRA